MSVYREPGEVKRTESEELVMELRAAQVAAEDRERRRGLADVPRILARARAAAVKGEESVGARVWWTSWARFEATRDELERRGLFVEHGPNLERFLRFWHRAEIRVYWDRPTGPAPYYRTTEPAPPTPAPRPFDGGVPPRRPAPTSMPTPGPGMPMKG